MIWSIDSTKKRLYQSVELDLIVLFSPVFLTLYHYSIVTTASLMTIIPQPRSKAHHQSKYN